MLRVFREDGADSLLETRDCDTRTIACPEGLTSIGWSWRKDMSDLYDKIKEEAAFHGIWEERVWFRIRAALSCTEWTEKHRRSWHS